MTTFKILLSYDGTDYVGWQRQANGVSIQALLEEALLALDGRAVTVAGAGRTDAGVHALGQVAAFTIAREIAASALVRALNAQLPAAIRVLDAEAVASTFHPRFDARGKTYRYRLWNGDVMNPFERGYAWHVPGPLDVEAMRAAAELLVGRHDFAAFQASGASVSTTVRDLAVSRIADCGMRNADRGMRIADCGRENPQLIPQSATRTPQSAMFIYEAVGTGFLRHMVRIIVGSLVQIGRGRRSVNWMGDVIASRDRTMAGPTAPPQGLFLVGVDYGDALAAGS